MITFPLPLTAAFKTWVANEFVYPPTVREPPEEPAAKLTATFVEPAELLVRVPMVSVLLLVPLKTMFGPVAKSTTPEPKLRLLEPPKIIADGEPLKRMVGLLARVTALPLVLSMVPVVKVSVPVLGIALALLRFKVPWVSVVPPV